MKNKQILQEKINKTKSKGTKMKEKTESVLMQEATNMKTLQSRKLKVTYEQNQQQKAKSNEVTLQTTKNRAGGRERTPTPARHFTVAHLLLQDYLLFISKHFINLIYVNSH